MFLSLKKVSIFKKKKKKKKNEEDEGFVEEEGEGRGGRTHLMHY